MTTIEKKVDFFPEFEMSFIGLNNIDSKRTYSLQKEVDIKIKSTSNICSNTYSDGDGDLGYPTYSAGDYSMNV